MVVMSSCINPLARLYTTVLLYISLLEHKLALHSKQSLLSLCAVYEDQTHEHEWFLQDVRPKGGVFTKLDDKDTKPSRCFSKHALHLP